MDEIQSVANTLVQDNMVIYLLGLGTLVGTFFFFRWQMKKHPTLKLGTIIKIIYIAENRESVFLFLAAMANFFEAMVSASIHPIGQAPINSFARFGAHGLVAAAAITCAIYFGQFVRAWFYSFTTFRKEPFKFFVRLIMVVASFIGMVGAPIVNLFIVANGTGEVDNCMYLIYEIFYSDRYMAAYYQFYGMPADYNPFARMSYVMPASGGMTAFHYLMMVLDSGAALDRDASEQWNTTGDLTNIHTKITNRSKEQIKKDKENFSSSIKMLLMRYGYKKDALDKTARNANKALDKMDEDTEKIRISGMAAKLCRDIRNWDSNTKPSLESNDKTDDIDKKQEEFKEQIRKLFAGAIRGGHGLGMTLKKI